MFGVVLVFVSIQHSLLVGRQHCGVFWQCVTVSGITSGPLPITGSVVVSYGRCVRQYKCLQLYFAQHRGRVHVACFSRLPTPSPALLLYFFYILLIIIYSVSFPPFFQFSVTGVGVGAGSGFFWRVVFVAGLHVGRALGCSGCLGLG